MKKSSATQPRNKTIYARQIAFAAAFLLPAAKLLEVPSILSKYAAGDILLPAVLHFLLQTLVLLALVYAASRSKTTLRERLKARFGKGIFVLYTLYCAYFLYAAALPLLDLDKFVYAAFFDTAPTAFSFGVFFVFSAYVCTKGVKSIGRSADLCLFLFPFSFLALLAMAFPKADYSNLAPFFGTKLSFSLNAFTRTLPHFSDAILLLPLIADLQYDEGDGVKILSGYWVGALLTLLFLATFYAVFSSLAPREHYAFSKIAQYYSALSVIGRIDLVFIYLLSIALLFYTCLPLQYATEYAARLFHTKRKTWISAVLHLFLFIALLFLNKYYDAFYAVISGKLSPIFLLAADVIPPFLLFLPHSTQNTTKELSYA